jgi:hypothetical protein
MAALMRLKQEEADRQNWLLSTQQQGVLAIPGVTSATQSDPTANATPGAAPGAAPGGVPGAVASLAQPPSTAPGTRDQTAGFSPFNRVLAGSYAKDPSMANFTTGINLGRTATLGPGQDYATQTALAQANKMPYDITTGQQRVFPTLPAGTSPGLVVSGGSEATSAGEKAGAVATDALAQQDSVLGATAKENLGVVDNLEQLYDKAAALGNTNWFDIATTQLGRRISTAIGMNVAKLGPNATMEDVKREINARFLATFGSLKDTQGNPLIRGGIGNVTAQFPDADSDPDVFHHMSAAMKAYLKRQQADGDAGDKFFIDRPTLGADQAAAIYRHQRGANAATAQQAQRDAGFDENKPAGSGPAPTPAPPPGSPPPAPPANKRFRWNPNTNQSEPY